MPAEETLATKLGELPVVSDGWSTALSYYSKVKDYNSVTKLTLSAAEGSLKKVAELSSPVLHRYQPQIDSVNAFTCSKLAELEERYPVVKQPTAEVKDACVDYVQPVVDKVKPYVTYAGGVVDNTHKAVNQIRSTGIDAITTARDVGVSKVTQAVTLTLDTPPGRLMTRTVDFALVQADNLIEKYMPEENSEEDSGDDKEGTDQVAETTTSPLSLTARAGVVSGKLRHRLHQRAYKDYQAAKKRTLEAVSHLQETIDLGDFAKTNLKGAYTKAQDIWTQINNEDENNETGTDESTNTYAQDLERKIIDMGRLITRQIRNGVASLESATAEAGLFVKDPISKSREYRDLVLQFGSENFPTTTEKARENLKLFQTKLQSMLNNVETSRWLSRSNKADDVVEMDEINN